MITAAVYFREHVVDPDVATAAVTLLEAVNGFLDEYVTVTGREVRMTSGYRSPEHNAKVGGARRSHHLTGHAIDIADYDKRLAKYCVVHVARLADLGLYCEDPRATKNWVHFQDVAPRSGARFFMPNALAASTYRGPLTVDAL